MNKKFRPWMFILIPFGIALFLAIGGFVVSWLWNALLPPLFDLPVIGFWQALGILALSRILFGGGFGGGGKHRRHRRHGGSGGHKGPGGHFTAEEREQIRQHLNMSPDTDEPES